VALRRSLHAAGSPIRNARIGTKVIAMVLLTSSIFVFVGLMGSTRPTT
jgi:hypothetical protein